jgi:hypothetical protein
MGRLPPRLRPQGALPGRSPPQELEFNFFFVAAALVLDVEGCTGGDVDSLAGDLEGEGACPFDGVGQPAQLGGELPPGVRSFQISFVSSGHR